MLREIIRETDKIDFWKVAAKYLGNKFSPGKIRGVENNIIKMELLNYSKIFSLLVDTQKYFENRHLFYIMMSRGNANPDLVDRDVCTNVVLAQEKDGFDFEGVLGAASSIALNFRNDVLGGIVNDIFPGCGYKFYFMKTKNGGNSSIYAGVPFFIVSASVWFENGLNFTPHILVHPSLRRMMCYVTRCLTKSGAISICGNNSTKIEYFYQRGRMLEALSAITKRASDNFYYCNKKKIGKNSTPIRTDWMSSISFVNLTKDIVTEIEHDGSFDAFRVININRKLRIKWITSPYSVYDKIIGNSPIYTFPSRPAYPIRRYMLARLNRSIEKKMNNVYALSSRKLRVLSSNTLKIDAEKQDRLHRGDLFWMLNDVLSSETRLFTENHSQEITRMARESIDFSQFIKKYSDPDLFCPFFSAGFSDSFSFRMNFTTMTVGIWVDLLVSSLALQKFENEKGFRFYKSSTDFECIREFPIHFSISRNSSAEDALKSLKVSSRIRSFHIIKDQIKNIVRVKQRDFMWEEIVKFIQKASNMFTDHLRKSPDFRKFVEETISSYRAAFESQEFRQTIMDYNLEKYSLLNEVKNCSRKSVNRSCPGLCMGKDIPLENFISSLQYFTGARIDLVPQKL